MHRQFQVSRHDPTAIVLSIEATHDLAATLKPCDTQVDP
jgi:hypothetical protein